RAAIAAKLERLGFLSPQRAGEVRAAVLPETWHSFPARAWQASARAARGARGDVYSTLDMGLQSGLQRLALRAASDAGPDVQVAILVVETRTRAVRAAIGSASRERPGGWLDLTAQPRSPGSTLKPFIYALAFDDGHAGPATRIADLPKRFAAYQPENFDRLFRGDVRVAEALQHSLNIPAVLALDRVGAERFAASLALAGAAPRLPARADGTPGLALALGGAGMTAQELAILYAALGDNGVARPLIWNEDAIDESLERPGYRLMGAQTAKSIRAILEATPTPAGRMPARLTANAPQIAFKTGTSYGFRDAWAAGVSDGHAIIVWVGRADGAPRPGETGRRAALPLLFEVADRALLHLGGAGPAESRLVQSSLPEARGGLSQFQTDNAPPEILFPPRGTELWAGSTNGQSARPFVFAGQGQGRLSWFVDGQPIARDDGGLPAWRPMAAGFYRVSAVDEAGRESAVSVRVLMED
ncbi:MAG: penicillin-binding transpeptidase domain-containing protein, partial [Pseudomonadota bacterium]